jgi:hypothetical protein
MCNDFDDSVARNTDPLTSHEALDDTDFRVRISEDILRIALEAGAKGITINECAERLPDYKAWSISPMFAPLVRKGLLVRRVIGITEPSRRWPNGKEVQETRVDPETHKPCTVNYHHSFALKRPPEAHKGPQQRELEYDAS